MTMMIIPIVMTLVGIVTDVSAAHPSKAQPANDGDDDDDDDEE